MRLRDHTCTIMKVITTSSSRLGSVAVRFSVQQVQPWAMTKGSASDYNTAKPAPGAEYKVMVCRSMSAIGVFVYLITVQPLIENIFLTLPRLMKTARIVLQMEAP